MTDKKLKDSLAQIEKYEGKASQSPESFSPSTRAGAHAARNEAIVKLRAAKDEYLKRVLDLATIVFVQGGDEDAHARLDAALCVAYDAGYFVAWYDSQPLYLRLASRIEASFGKNRTISSIQETILIKELQQAVIDAGFAGAVLTPKVDKNKSLSTYSDVVEFVRKFIQKSSGEALNSHMIRREFLHDMLDEKVDSKNIAVLVSNAPAETQGALKGMFGNSYVVDLSVGAPEGVSEDEWIASIAKDVVGSKRKKKESKAS
jgi:sulfur relay (sulfurtransferase) DsrC/TusE family protein